MNFTFPPRFVLVSLFVCACLRERECKHVCHRAHRVRLSVVALRELDDRMQRSQQTHTHTRTHRVCTFRCIASVPLASHQFRPLAPLHSRCGRFWCTKKSQSHIRHCKGSRNGGKMGS
uniref:Putative secreted peptide n=1 Tax=Anopheles braziliensis TaxID=58242 RepID=A0A2M3ZUY9_9DIPT